MVSIIIPVYHAEQYVRACLESLVRQTYADIEILVVDDGSQDNSAKIASDMAKQDARIRVIAQENHGVSAARNLGLRNAKGEYVTFIDADDYVAPEYVEYLLSMMTDAKADFGMSQNAYTDKGQAQIEKDEKFQLESDRAVAFLLSPRVIVGCWNKMFKRQFLLENEIYFSEELFYGEGLQFIVRAAGAANKVAVGSKRVYYYRRNNASSATTKFDVRKIQNGEKSLLVIRDQVNLEDPGIAAAWELHYCTFCLGGMTKILANHAKKDCQQDYQRFHRYLRQHVWSLVKNPKVSAYRKMMLLGGCISPWVMMKLDVARRKRISNRSI